MNELKLYFTETCDEVSLLEPASSADIYDSGTRLETVPSVIILVRRVPSRCVFGRGKGRNLGPSLVKDGLRWSSRSVTLISVFQISLRLLVTVITSGCWNGLPVAGCRCGLPRVRRTNLRSHVWLQRTHVGS